MADSIWRRLLTKLTSSKVLFGAALLALVCIFDFTETDMQVIMTLVAAVYGANAVQHVARALGQRKSNGNSN